MDSDASPHLFDVSSSASEPRWGHVSGNQYVMTRPSGFFSEMSVALQDLARLGPRVRSIDSRKALSRLKDARDHDLFAKIFAPPRGRVTTSSWFAKHKPHHGRYCDLPFEESRALLQRWFRLRHTVKSRARRLAKQKRLVPNRTIAVNLRGSDKHVEVEPTPIETWVEFVSELHSAFPDLDVWVFSEDQDLVDDFFARATFPVKDFGQSLRTTGGQGMRFALKGFDASREKFAVDFVAQTWLVSQAKLVVTYTGNTAYWTALFRGCGWGFFQFTSQPGTVGCSFLPCFIHRAHNHSLDGIARKITPVE